MKSIPTSGHRVEKVVEREFKSGTKFKNGDVLMARITPCLENGKTAYVDCLSDEEVAWGSTEFIVLRGKENFIKHWVYLLCRNQKFIDFAVQNMSGTSGRQRVPASILEKYVFPFPSDELLKVFANLINPFFEKIKNNSIENQNLADLRDTLLPRLLNGEIDLSKIEIEENQDGL